MKCFLLFFFVGGIALGEVFFFDFVGPSAQQVAVRPNQPIATGSVAKAHYFGDRLTGEVWGRISHDLIVKRGDPCAPRGGAEFERPSSVGAALPHAC